MHRKENGTSPVCEARPADPGEWEVLKLGAVTYGTFDPNENKAFVGNIGQMRVNEVRPGDVLMTRKNTRQLVGAVAVPKRVWPRLLLPDLNFRLDLDLARVDRDWFHAFMMSRPTRDAVRNLSSGSAASMPNLSKQRLRTLSIQLPGLNRQRDFASRVARVELQRERIQYALAAADALFASLQSRALRGEL